MTCRRARLRIDVAALGLALFAHCRWSGAQTQIGSVATEDAIVTGNTATGNSRSVLIGNVTVVAKDHPAYVELMRGGSVKVCSTSGVHLTAGNPIAAPMPKQDESADSAIDSSPNSVASAKIQQFPLMVSLDRGAAELHTVILASDVLMTPDLKVSFSESGPLDLRMRVASNGDTCVENRIAGLDQHPTLEIGSLFGNDSYKVLPGQHVMFEHGNLREVVDNESSPCGCPGPSVKVVEPAPSVSLLPGTKVPTLPAAAQFPFPTAISQGLAPPPPVPQAEPGVVHTQVSTMLTYKGDQPAPNPAMDSTTPESKAAMEPKGAPAPKPVVERKSGLFHSVGHFFKKVFGGS